MATAAAGPAPQAMFPSVTSDTDVGEAIRAACAELRKPFPEAAVAALQAEWFNTAGELAALPDDTARSLGVPLRLKHAVADMLGGACSAAAAEAAPLLALPGSGNGGDAVQPQTEQQRAAADAAAEAVVASSLAEVVTATVEGSGREAVAWDQSHLPIEQRQMPRYRGNSSNLVPKVSKRTTSTKYALSVSWTGGEAALASMAACALWQLTSMAARACAMQPKACPPRPSVLPCVCLPYLSCLSTTIAPPCLHPAGRRDDRGTQGRV